MTNKKEIQRKADELIGHIFQWLAVLGAKHLEVGYPSVHGADLDITGPLAIARQAPIGITLAVWARCNEAGISAALEILAEAKQATPCLRIMGDSKFLFGDASGERYEQAKALAIAAVRQAKIGLANSGRPATIKFCPENLGNKEADPNRLIEAFREIAAAGADVIDLADAGDKYVQPVIFSGMMAKFAASLPASVAIMAFCHDGLNMIKPAGIVDEAHYKDGGLTMLRKAIFYGQLGAVRG